MAKPKRECRRKSVPSDEKHEPVEIEVRFSLSKPPPPPFIGAPPLPPPAKEADGEEKPPVIFRL